MKLSDIKDSASHISLECISCNNSQFGIVLRQISGGGGHFFYFHIIPIKMFIKNVNVPSNKILSLNLRTSLLIKCNTLFFPKCMNRASSF